MVKTSVSLWKQYLPIYSARSSSESHNSLPSDVDFKMDFHSIQFELSSGFQVVRTEEITTIWIQNVVSLVSLYTNYTHNTRHSDKENATASSAALSMRIVHFHSMIFGNVYHSNGTEQIDRTQSTVYVLVVLLADWSVTVTLHINNSLNFIT